MTNQKISMREKSEGLFDITAFTKVGIGGLFALFLIQLISFMMISRTFGGLPHFGVIIVSIQYISIKGPWPLFGIIGGLIRKQKTGLQQTFITYVSGILIFVSSYVLFDQYPLLVIFNQPPPSVWILFFGVIVQIGIGIGLGLLINQIVIEKRSPQKSRSIDHTD